MIPSSSTSVKIQIIGGKDYLREQGKTLLGIVNKLLNTKSLLTCFAYTPQANFLAHNLNFHWRWWDQIQATFKFFFYFTLILLGGMCNRYLLMHIVMTLLWNFLTSAEFRICRAELESLKIWAKSDMKWESKEIIKHSRMIA